MTARTPRVSCVFVCHDGAGRLLPATLAMLPDPLP